MSISDKVLRVVGEDKTIHRELLNGVDVNTARKNEIKRIDGAISILKDFRKGFEGTDRVTVNRRFLKKWENSIRKKVS